MGMSSSSSTVQFESSREMGIYEPFRQVPMAMWKNSFENGSNNILYTGNSTIVEEVVPRQETKIKFMSHESAGPSENDQEANKSTDDNKRRLAQNREAARKSRLRKKAYVQQLESSRMKLAQLEQELERSRNQGAAFLGSNNSASLNSEMAAFEIKYGYWVEELNRQNSELRNALQARVPSDVELGMLVENGLNHYYSLFQMKEVAAKSDIFYLMSGIWRTSAERFFLWIGGFRPSDLLKVVMPHIEPMNDQQVARVNSLRQSSQQAEDALSQGIDKLHQNLAFNMAADPITETAYESLMADAIEKLDALEIFVTQADHLRLQTMRQMARILRPNQAARALLALGDYFHRLRALSSLWAARPRDPSA
ncbi:transcription factor TGA7-like isoform X3 [Humulus lupulus]|uniref:transcription factor TGA7-like isoform X3 n=1 Tax=Humulus lupulus TaxID=3486 RepID=UPI002B406862|nr:transcription factor TGA7-like isoform X3 [Humulus lupulus]